MADAHDAQTVGRLPERAARRWGARQALAFQGRKTPRHVAFVDEFAMTTTGTIQRVELRERARAEWAAEDLR